MGRLRRTARRSGTILIAVGLAVLGYAAAVVFWRDPVTDVYTAYQQRGLRSSLHRADETWHRLALVQIDRQPQATVSLAAARAEVRRLAASFARAHRGHDGAALGKLVIPRFGLSTVFVEGTDYWHSLTKGPGRYEQTSYPGLGRTTAIAGHRTTWSAPFRHIDSLRDGDRITLEMPYGTFVYRVLRHRIVANDDWSIIRRVGFDELVLSACHPLYSAAQRYVIFAKLVSETLPGQKRSIPAV